MGTANTLGYGSSSSIGNGKHYIAQESRQTLPGSHESARERPTARKACCRLEKQTKACRQTIIIHSVKPLTEIDSAQMLRLRGLGNIGKQI